MNRLTSVGVQADDETNDRKDETMVAKSFVLIGTVAAVLSMAAPASADGTTQSTNESQAASARSGSAANGNVSRFDAGPRATSGGGSSTASQDGDNTGELNQESRQRSGDAAAGSTVSARTGGGSVQGANTSQVAVASSGAARGANVATGTLGPQSSAGLEGASSVQSGSNGVAVRQSVGGVSGDAVAGSQTTGVLA